MTPDDSDDEPAEKSPGSTPAELAIAANVIPEALETQMARSYLDYAMSVIVGRALPDVRDGLKPVHRRILYAMSEAGASHTRPYRKSARIVGEVMGKYHPHGDQAIYDTLVRMAQDFSLRYPLVDGQGNFGSIDGDNAAAMRYTESRMASISQTLLADLDAETVNWDPNYDGSLEEPKVLPALLPNLLVNGAAGIAVGMATNMAPHNLNEVVDGLLQLLDEPETDIITLFQSIQGPDFPTGGYICGINGILSAYVTGRGSFKVRGKTHFEDRAKGGKRIIITEIPYNVNKNRLLENISDLVKNKQVEGIVDLRDESDRRGMRVVVALRRDAVEEVVLNHLFKHSALESTFSINSVALVKGRPQVLNLKQILEAYLEHRREIITRRTEHQLRKAQARLHIIEGLLKAQEHMDRVIQLIRESESADTASLALQAELELSPLQAKAILDMRLAKLARLERQALHDEHGELTTLISRLEAILADPAEVDQLIRTELEGLATKYGDARRTEILEMEEEIDIADLIPKHEVVITKTAGGYIKRLPLDTYRAQHRGGVGLRGLHNNKKKNVIEVYVTHSHDVVLFFSNFGRLFWLPAYRLPETGRHARGTAIVNLFPQLEPEEKILCLIPVEEFAEDRYLVFATTNGQIKKTVLAEYRRSRRQGLKAVVLKEGHELVGASISDGDDYVVIATANGKAIRFHESEVRSMGRVAAGVRGMKLREGDRVVSMALVKEEAQLLSITENGFGKRTPVEAYAPKHRGGMGVITIQTNERNGNVVGVLPIEGAPDLIISTVQGMVIRTPVEGISESGRAAMGVRLMRPKEDDRIVAVALYAGNGDEEKEDGNDEGREGDTEEAEPKDENEASTPSEPDPTGSD